MFAYPAFYAWTFVVRLHGEVGGLKIMVCLLFTKRTMLRTCEHPVVVALIAAFCAAIFTPFWATHYEKSKEQWTTIWQLKRDTLLEALEIANAVISHSGHMVVNTSDLNSPRAQLVQQEISTQKARAVHDKLLLLVSNATVIDAWLQILAPIEPIGEIIRSPRDLQNLRKLIRQELNLSPIESTRSDVLFLGCIHGDPKGENIC